MKVEWISFYLFVFAGVIQLVWGFIELVRPRNNFLIKLYGESALQNISFEVAKVRFGMHLLNVLLLGVGLNYIFKQQIRMAGVVTGFSGLGMLLSALTLLWLSRQTMRAALVEGVPVLMAFIFLIFHIVPFV